MFLLVGRTLAGALHCLHTNTSLEFPNAPDEVLRIIAERTAGIEGAIYVVLRRAQAEGMLDPKAEHVRLRVSISGSPKASASCTRCSAMRRRCATSSRSP